MCLVSLNLTLRPVVRFKKKLFEYAYKKYKREKGNGLYFIGQILKLICCV